MNVGIDTVKVRFTDYEIKPGAGLQVFPGTIDFATSEQKEDVIYNGKGCTIVGSKAVRNTDKYNLTLSNRGCFVQMSLPKVLNDDNTSSIDKTETKKALQFIEQDLRENGIHTNIFNQDLSRVDLFRGAITDNVFLNYVPIFQLLHGKRQNRRDYGTSFLYGNTQRQSMFYDKAVERAIRQGENIKGSTNDVRCEHRLLTKKSVQPTGLVVTNDLLKSFNDLHQVYLKGVRSVFQSEDLEQSIQAVTSNEWTRLFYELKAERGRLTLRELDKVGALYGWHHILGLTSIDRIIFAFCEASDNANKRDLAIKARKKIQGLLIGRVARKTDYKTMYSELYKKFAA